MKKLYIPGQFYRQLQLYREGIARLRYDEIYLNESNMIYVNELIYKIQKQSLTQRFNILSEIVCYVRINGISTLKLLIEKPIRKSELTHQSADY